MALPLAHSLVGLSACLLLRPKEPRLQDAVLASFLTVLPDFDLIAVFVVGPEGHYWHHTVTHTFAFGVLGGLMMLLVTRLRRGKTQWREAAVVAMLIASHTVVDYFTVDESFPRGVPLWWPLSVEFHVAPVPLFLNIERGGLTDLLGAHNLRAVVREILITAPLFWLSYWYYSRRCGPGLIRRMLSRES